MPVKLIIDPGHGGKDPGAVSNGLKEKDLVLAISRGIYQELKPYEVEVYLTRDSDIFLSLSSRTEVANSKKADYFISVHINAGGGTGFESFIFTSPSATSIAAQKQIHNNISSFLSKEGFANRGPKRANFAVLRNSNMPAILIETLFIDTLRDAQWLAKQNNIANLARVTAQALVSVLQLKQKATVWSPATEIAALINKGLLNTLRASDKKLAWGEFATILNRIRKRYVKSSKPWDPEAEIKLLVEDRILAGVRPINDAVFWGEYATVLNRIRNQRVLGGSIWEPDKEIGLLLRDRLLVSGRSPKDIVYWGEFATVLNRYLATKVYS